MLTRLLLRVCVFVCCLFWCLCCSSVPNAKRRSIGSRVAGVVFHPLALSFGVMMVSLYATRPNSNQSAPMDEGAVKQTYAVAVRTGSCMLVVSTVTVIGTDTERNTKFWKVRKKQPETQLLFES